MDRRIIAVAAALTVAAPGVKWTGEQAGKFIRMLNKTGFDVMPTGEA